MRKYGWYYEHHVIQAVYTNSFFNPVFMNRQWIHDYTKNEISNTNWHFQVCEVCASKWNYFETVLKIKAELAKSPVLKEAHRENVEVTVENIQNLVHKECHVLTYRLKLLSSVTTNVYGISKSIAPGRCAMIILRDWKMTFAVVRKSGGGLSAPQIIQPSAEHTTCKSF